MGQRAAIRAVVVLAAAAIVVIASMTSTSSGAKLHGASAATADAIAYRVLDDAGTHGYVSASGTGTQTTRGAGASASTAGGHGSASAYVQLKHVSLFDGLIRAASVSVDASADANGGGTGGRISKLEIDGSPVGSPRSRQTYDLNGYGSMVVLGGWHHGIAAIRAKLTKDYNGIPAGSTVVLAFVSAAASDAVAGARSGEGGSPSAPPASGSQNGSGGGSPASGGPSPAASPPPVPRRVPPQVRLLNTKRGFTFPVAGPHNYVDTFGAFRADTGFHEGNDIFAAAGTPLVAVTAGTLFNVGTLRISGNRLWVRSNKGDCFFYAHLSAFATDARDGLRVKAGQVIGFVGSTGDAEKTPSHLHFEVHPGCGPAVDPYPFLRAWEGRRDVPAAAWLVRYGRDAGVRPGALVELRDFLDGG